MSTARTSREGTAKAAAKPRATSANRSANRSVNRRTQTPRSVKPVADLDQPQWFFNRELSWLEFNQRVLEEAQDERNPPLERLKFLAIVSSNLDEFFEIRVAGLQGSAETRPFDAGPDGMTPSQTLDAISRRAKKLVEDQYRCYRDGVVPALSAAGIDLLTVEDLEEKGRSWAASHFASEVFPVLTPLAVDPAHPFPQLANKSLNLVVELRVPDRPGEIDGLLRDEQHSEFRLGVVQVPRILPRLIEVPTECAPPGRKVYLFLSSLISAFIGELFPGLEVRGCYAFRVTRNSELYLDEDEADNLLEAMQEQLALRRKGHAVRLEVQRGANQALVALLSRTFDLDDEDVYQVDGPLNLTRLMAVYGGEKRPDLKDEPFRPATPSALRDIETGDEFFNVLAHEDVLLHHPYESFDVVTRFIEIAADDPKVLAIKITLYRTSKDSPIVKALMRAAQKGKQVTALVELKARFDEENNIQWARAMEEAGVHVVYGLVGLKTHSKLGLVVRRDDSGLHRYVHLGTGNYNEVTARIYTDLGMLTSNHEIGEDAAAVFNLLTGMSQFPGLKQLKMAPFGLDQEFISRIEREAEWAKRSARSRKSEDGSQEKSQAEISSPDSRLPTSREARIIAKMNSLEDPGVIKALYRASQAGVQVDLIVRGICMLRPGVPGLSENIRVRSIIGRFLEHSRVYYFHNGGDEEILCGSADFMRRNFYRRVEIIYPVLNTSLRDRLRDEVLERALEDNVKAREILPDGTHRRVERASGEEKSDYQNGLLNKFKRGKKKEARPANTTPSLTPLSMLEPPKITPRPAPLIIDGLPGTGADPVLNSLQQSLQGSSQNSASRAAVAEQSNGNPASKPKAAQKSEKSQRRAKNQANSVLPQQSAREVADELETASGVSVAETSLDENSVAENSTAPAEDSDTAPIAETAK